MQIAADLAPSAHVTLATRRPIKWLRQRTLGRDIHWWLHTTGLDTAPLSRWLQQLPVAVLDDGRYQAAVSPGRPDRRPMFKRLDRHDVIWSDNSREHIDLLILATGYRATFPFLENTQGLAADGTPRHRGGVSTTMPGLGYVGLEFQRSFSSATVRGVARDARHVLAALNGTTLQPAHPETGRRRQRPPAVLRTSKPSGSVNDCHESSGAAVASTLDHLRQGRAPRQTRRSRSVCGTSLPAGIASRKEAEMRLSSRG